MAVTSLLGSTALVALALACTSEPPPAATQGRALGRITSAIGRPTLAPAPPETRLSIAHEPEALQVYRSTRVRLTAVLPPQHGGATCRWSFGGGVAPEAASDACAIEHTFIGGTADERVTVTASDGPWSETVTRIVPLERLPVSSRPVEADPSPGVPEKPSDPDSFRMVVIADTAGMDDASLARLSRRIVAVGADLVVHLGGHARDGEEWNRLREHLGEGLRAAEIPLLPAISPADVAAGSEVRRPLGEGGEQLDLLEGASFPERWAFSWKGVFMAFMGGADQTSATLDWLRERLLEAQIYESRIVFSYLPLHPFGEVVPEGPAPHTLGPKFKVYETLLRARTTAFVSAAHRVYFKGRYGALPVVSVGSVAAGGHRLLGHEVAQPASLVVIDFARGLPQRVFALVPDAAGEPFAEPLDEAYLPETVEVYTR
jgi:hypothetical protein